MSFWIKDSWISTDNGSDSAVWWWLKRGTESTTTRKTSDWEGMLRWRSMDGRTATLLKRHYSKVRGRKRPKCGCTLLFSLRNHSKRRHQVSLGRRMQFRQLILGRLAKHMRNSTRYTSRWGLWSHSLNILGGKNCYWRLLNSWTRDTWSYDVTTAQSNLA